jgi:hypothetical protein
MTNPKRLTIATLSGLLCGFICYGLASSGPAPVPGPAMWQIIFSRTLIGFAIGISTLRLGHWAFHGMVMGLLFSLPLAFSGLMAPDNPQYSAASMFVMTVVLGLMYGLLIELITTALFKAGQVRAVAATAAV